MNEDVKKNLRTQGKYSGGTDKRQKESPVYKESAEKVSHARKRHSNEHKEGNNSFTNVVEEDSPLKYQENSSHSFNELEDVKTPQEIRDSGLHMLSETESGKSLILYEPKFCGKDANKFFDILLEDTKWNSKNIVIRGVEYPQPRLVAWYGPLPYTYSGVTLEPQEMPPVILHIKKRIEEYLLTKDITASFNSVLLNYYRNGKDSVAWHSDDELTMGISPTIASISLGETRKFEMKRKIRSYKEDVTDDDVDKYFINLIHGSLLIMTGVMQRDWQHRIPKEYHDKDGRINLTFRTVHAIDRSPGNPSENVKKQIEKCSKLDTPPNSNVKFNEDEFPPLSSTLNTVNLFPKESVDTGFINSVLSSKNDDANNMVNDFSNEPGLHPGVNDVESWDNQPYDINKSEENFSNKQVIHPNVDNAEIWNNNIVENLNDSWGKTDFDMTTKNIGLGDISNSNFSIEDGQSFDSDMNSPSETGCTKPSVFNEASINNGQTLDCCVDNPVFIQKSDSHLNADAQEFVPSISPVPSTQETGYGSFDLSKLLECDVRCITNVALWDYAYALRVKIMNRIEEFDYFVKDSLSFLSDLMEERQSERTQRLITEKMQKIACEYFDELDYSGNSSHDSKLYDNYSEQENITREQREYTDSHRGKGHIRETGSNKGDMRNQNKRQNFRGGYYNRQEANSIQDFSQGRKINSKRGTFASRGRFSANRNKSYTHFSGRVDWNGGTDHYYEEGLSDQKKEESTKDCSSEKEFSSRKNWIKIANSYNSNSRNHDFYREKEYKPKKFSGQGSRNSNNRFYPEEFLDEEKENANKDYSGHIEKNSASSNQSSNKDFYDWGKRDSNSEKNYNQKEISRKRESDVDGRSRNFYSRGRVISGGRKYSSQERFSNKEESHSNQEIFSNKEERNSGRGYSKIRKDFANKGRGSATE